MSVEIDPQELGFRRMFPYPMSQEAVKREKGRAGVANFCVARSLHRRSLADPTDQEPQHHACSFQGTRPSSGDVNEGGVPRLTGGQVKTTAPKQYVNSSLSMVDTGWTHALQVLRPAQLWPYRAWSRCRSHWYDMPRRLGAPNRGAGCC